MWYCVLSRVHQHVIQAIHICQLIDSLIKMEILPRERVIEFWVDYKIMLSGYFASIYNVSCSFNGCNVRQLCPSKKCNHLKWSLQWNMFKVILISIILLKVRLIFFNIGLVCDDSCCCVLPYTVKNKYAVFNSICTLHNIVCQLL